MQPYRETRTNIWLPYNLYDLIAIKESQPLNVQFDMDKILNLEAHICVILSHLLWEIEQCFN